MNALAGAIPAAYSRVPQLSTDSQAALKNVGLPLTSVSIAWIGRASCFVSFPSLQRLRVCDNARSCSYQATPSVFSSVNGQRRISVQSPDVEEEAVRPDKCEFAAARQRIILVATAKPPTRSHHKAQTVRWFELCLRWS